MPVESDSSVEQMKRVQSEDGDLVAPASERSARQTYRQGDVKKASTSSDYPVEFNPDATIYELLIFEAGAVSVQITTTSGDTFSLSLNGNGAVFDRWEIDSVTFPDPGTDEPLQAAWAGE